jgi:hypothetical protein
MTAASLNMALLKSDLKGSDQALKNNETKIDSGVNCKA